MNRNGLSLSQKVMHLGGSCFVAAREELVSTYKTAIICGMSIDGTIQGVAGAVCYGIWTSL